MKIGSPLRENATKIMLCGSGELGKELCIAFARLGVEVIALDRYENAPAMQVAHRSYVLSMLDGKGLKEIAHKEKPDFIVPEIEAIDTDALCELEAEGYTIIPNAKATRLTMNREGIRRLAAEELRLKTTSYQIVDNLEDFKSAVQAIGLPCISKPIMSSSGKGQQKISALNDIESAWQQAVEGGRAQNNKVIVEAFLPFDYEITLLTVRHQNGTSFCEPIGHKQVAGDYRESWQPHPMADNVLLKAQEVAKTITDGLGGYGLFGVELFIKDNEVIFNEVSPRPHDTGLVTLISQNLSEFTLHARAILGLPIPNITQYGPSASCALVVKGTSNNIQFANVDEALSLPDTDLCLFGKGDINGKRRLGVALAKADTIENARQKATNVINALDVQLAD